MKSYDKKLEFITGQLDSQSRESLLSFAEFLLTQQLKERQDHTIQQPQPIVRPDEESVIGAMKRLATTYPMLNKDLSLLSLLCFWLH